MEHTLMLTFQEARFSKILNKQARFDFENCSSVSEGACLSQSPVKDVLRGARLCGVCSLTQKSSGAYGLFHTEKIRHPPADVPMSDIRPTPVYQIPWTPKTRLPDIRVSDSKKTDNLTVRHVCVRYRRHRKTGCPKPMCPRRRTWTS